jgi:hypothetical protein
MVSERTVPEGRMQFVSSVGSVNAVIIALNARANNPLQDERFVVFVFQVLRLCVDEPKHDFLRLFEIKEKPRHFSAEHRATQ